MALAHPGTCQMLRSSMAEPFGNAERSHRALKWGSIVQVQRWWRGGHGRRASLDLKTIRNCHTKLMTTGSVADVMRNGRPSTSRSQDVETVRQTIECSPKKSLRQATKETGNSA
ncbi:unnamed protein product [Darwinula stevensoni]|uniref:Uncharacterized protein n=1 Tax=Darwinula stevensoni TaxID=69355 RepID=A0A7R9AE02_9CRUS|nr:unnamed protein product [Darwinula stevensoni]CAG0901828.1 unnamed protein product [Darwinula stevensoni]